MLEDTEKVAFSLKEVKDTDPAYSETPRTPTLEAGPSSIISHMDKVQLVKKAWKPDQLRASVLQEYSMMEVILDSVVIPGTETHLSPSDSTLGRPLVAGDVSGLCSVAENPFLVNFLVLTVVDCCH